MAAASLVALNFSGATLSLNYDDTTLLVTSITADNPGSSAITVSYTSPAGNTHTHTLAAGANVTIPLPLVDQITLPSAIGKLSALLAAGASVRLSVSG